MYSHEFEHEFEIEIEIEIVRAWSIGMVFEKSFGDIYSFERMLRCKGNLQIAFRYGCSTSHGVNAPIAKRSDTDADGYQITILDAAIDWTYSRLALR